MAVKWFRECHEQVEVIFVEKDNIIGFARRCEYNGKRGYRVVIPSELWTPEYIGLLKADMPDIDTTRCTGLEYHEQGKPERVLGELYLSAEWNEAYRRNYFYITNVSGGKYLLLKSAEQVLTLIGCPLDYRGE